MVLGLHLNDLLLKYDPSLTLTSSSSGLSFHHYGLYLWNRLPEDHRAAEIMEVSKKFKGHILNMAFK